MLKKAMGLPSFEVPVLSKGSVEILMRTHWPKVFGEGVCVPLDHRICDELIPRAVDLAISPSQVRSYVKERCMSLRYLKCIAKGGDRLKANGDVAGSVAADERVRAVMALAEKFDQHPSIQSEVVECLA